jgi:hypothetical protein
MIIHVPKTLGNFHQPPLISTLENYTHLTTNEFVVHLKNRIDGSGVFTAIELTKSYQNFDLLSDSDKRKFVDSIEQPEHEKTLVQKLLQIFKS